MRKFHPMQIKRSEANLPKKLVEIQRQADREFERDHPAGSLDDIADSGQDIDITGLSGNYNGGRAAIGRFGIDNEGMGDSLVWHAENNGHDYYASLGMTPVGAGADLAAFTLQTWTDPGDDLLVYGGFETGDFTGWTKTTETNGAWSIGAADSYGGSYHAVFAADGTGTQTGRLTSGTISGVADGDYFVFQGYISKEKLDNTRASVWVNDTTTGVTYYAGDITNEAEDTWTRVSCVFHCTGTAGSDHNLRVVFEVRSTNAAPCLLRFDSFVLYKCTEAALYNFSYDGYGNKLEGGPGESNRNTTGTFTTQIMVLRVFQPLKITRMEWQIRNAGTYELHRLWAANIANSYQKIGDIVTTVSYEMPHVDFSPALLLTPGIYYFGLTRPAGAVTWCDYDTAIFPIGSDMMLDGIYYGTSGYTYVAPVWISYQKQETL